MASKRNDNKVSKMEVAKTQRNFLDAELQFKNTLPKVEVNDINSVLSKNYRIHVSNCKECIREGVQKNPKN